MAVDIQKNELRQKARAGRPGMANRAGPEAGERLADNFFKAAQDFPGPVQAVSGYWPMADEIDVRPLMARLHGQGRTVALPVVAGAKEPLQMAQAMKLAVQSGRLAYEAGRIPKKLYATASSPIDGMIDI